MATVLASIALQVSASVWVSGASAKNEILVGLKRTGVKVSVCQTPEQAVQKAEDGSAVMLLCEGQAEQPQAISQSLIDDAKAKKLRLYIEYAKLPGKGDPKQRTCQWERAIVSSTIFGNELDQKRILTIHATPFIEQAASNPWIVIGRVAGFDSAVFGIPKTSWPLLYEFEPGILVCTTKLSRFDEARFAPVQAWQQVWVHVLKYLSLPSSRLSIEPSVRPSYSKSQKLKAGAERAAAKRAREWFKNAKLLIDLSWQNQYAEAAKFNDRVVPFGALGSRITGDGSFGVMEGFSSSMDASGFQPERWWVRADCNGETAMTFALSEDPAERKIGQNIADYLMLRSIQSQAERADLNSPVCGLIGWNNVARYWGSLDGYKVFYGDDNARAMLGVMAAAGALSEDKWDEPLLKCLLGNLRTTGKKGFRTDRLEQDDILKNGWKHYWNQEPVNNAPHFEAYLWACNLWAYHKTMFKPFLERTLEGLKTTMETDTKNWRWGGGTIELSRMLLPLAWLVRVDDSMEHRKWLADISDKLIALQDESGAIQEKLSSANRDYFGAPQSNEEYGTTETPIIQENGDPLADMLYSCNFAFLGLNEAYCATKEPRYRQACDKLANFLCRIQIKSKRHPELDGGWYRAFDYRNWDYWGSNGDAGWGAWAIESGWTVTWISSVMEMRQRKTSLWDITKGSRIRRLMPKIQPTMLPYEG